MAKNGAKDTRTAMLEAAAKIFAATTLPAAKSDWRDYATLTDKERALCRFFKLKAELD